MQIKKPLKTSPCLEMDIDKAIENVHKDSDVSLKAEQIQKKKSSKVYKWKSIIHKRQLGKLQLKSNDECRENCTNFDESLSQAHAHLVRPDCLTLNGKINTSPNKSPLKACKSPEKRFLSVPNLALDKTQIQLLHDLRYQKQSPTHLSQGLFAGNVIKCFSKFSIPIFKFNVF